MSSFKAGQRERGFAGVQRGDHILLVYEDAVELLAFIVPYIKQGLTEGERCIYVVDDRTSAQVSAVLTDHGVDISRETARGALLLLNRQEQCAAPPFDIPQMAKRILTRATTAGGGGFAGVRFAAELTCALGMYIPDDILAGYDSLLDMFNAPNNLTFVCMCRKDRVRPDTLRRIIRSHAKVLVGDHVYLSLCPMFQDLARTDLESLLQSAHERCVRKGEFFYRQGDQAKDVYVLTRGKVKLVGTNSTGRNAILDIVTPTEPFGHVAALCTAARLVSSEALEDSRALVWDTPTMLRTMMAHPAVSLSTIRLMAKHAREEWVRAQDLTTERVEQRIAHLLPQLAQSIGRKLQDREGVELPISEQELAELVSTTPFTVNRILAGWKRRNLVDVGRERIRVLDPAGITAIARSP
jgi:CRP/FNR family transcriptional regulator, nitrogen oxide reductase regulator